jgi:hypothetical protein
MRRLLHRGCAVAGFHTSGGALPTAAALADVADARRRIFGDEPGNGLRSGRKVLRRTLRGPSALSWYGASYNDVFPTETGVFVNEDDYRLEVNLNRVGKSRMKGKMKHFKKPFLDSVRLDDALERVRARARASPPPLPSLRAAQRPIPPPPPPPHR